MCVVNQDSTSHKLGPKRPLGSYTELIRDPRLDRRPLFRFHRRIRHRRLRCRRHLRAFRGLRYLDYFLRPIAAFAAVMSFDVAGDLRSGPGP